MGRRGRGCVPQAPAVGPRMCPPSPGGWPEDAYRRPRAGLPLRKDLSSVSWHLNIAKARLGTVTVPRRTLLCFGGEGGRLWRTAGPEGRGREPGVRAGGAGRARGPTARYALPHSAHLRVTLAALGTVWVLERPLVQPPNARVAGQEPIRFFSVPLRRRPPSKPALVTALDRDLPPSSPKRAPCRLHRSPCLLRPQPPPSVSSSQAQLRTSRGPGWPKGPKSSKPPRVGPATMKASRLSPARMARSTSERTASR